MRRHRVRQVFKQPYGGFAVDYTNTPGLINHM